LSILKDIAKGYEFSQHASLEYVKNEEKFKEKNVADKADTVQFEGTMT